MHLRFVLLLTDILKGVTRCWILCPEQKYLHRYCIVELVIICTIFCFSQAQKQYAAHLHMSTHLVVN